MREYLMALRKKRNESQQDVADSIGISRQYYSMIEDQSRQKRMDIVLVTALAKHFAIPVTTLLEEEAKISQVSDS